MSDENGYSTRHPHEPKIPPALDGEGRCLVCVLIVERDRLQADLKVATEGWDTLRVKLSEAVAEKRRLQDHLAIHCTEDHRSEACHGSGRCIDCRTEPGHG